MSVRLYWNKLKPEQQDAITKLLVIPPKESFFDIKRKGWKKKFKKYSDDDGTENDGEDESKTVIFYLYDPQTDIIRVPYKFTEKLLNYNVNNDISLYNNPFNFNGQLFENQLKLYNDAWTYLLANKTLNFCPYTGSGKTAMAIKMSSDLSKFQNVGIILIMMTITSLLEQWYKSIKDFTDAIPYIIDKPSFNPPLCCNVFITTPGMSKYIPESLRSQVGVFIIDEAHTFCSISRVEALLSFQPKYVIACTATFEKDNEMHKMIEAITGTDRIELIPEKPFTVYRINTGCNQEVPKNKFGDCDWNELVNMMCKDEYRNGLILEYVKMYSSTNKILIMSLRQEHVKLLHKKTIEMGIASDFMTGNKKNYHDSNVLFGSIQKLGTGFDEAAKCPDFNGVRIDRLLLCFTIKSLPTLKQVEGRILYRSEFPTIDCLIDDNYKAIEHFKKMEKHFLSITGTVVEVNTPKHLENQKNKVSPVGNVDTVAYKQALELKNKMVKK